MGAIIGISSPSEHRWFDQTAQRLKFELKNRLKIKFRFLYLNRPWGIHKRKKFFGKNGYGVRILGFCRSLPNAVLLRFLHPVHVDLVRFRQFRIPTSRVEPPTSDAETPILFYKLSGREIKINFIPTTDDQNPKLRLFRPDNHKTLIPKKSPKTNEIWIFELTKIRHDTVIEGWTQILGYFAIAKH